MRTKGTVYLIGLTDIGGLHSHRGVKKGAAIRRTWPYDVLRGCI